MRELFEKLQNQQQASVEVELENGKTKRGSIVEILGDSVGMNLGSGVEYIAYRYMVSVKAPTPVKKIVKK